MNEKWSITRSEPPGVDTRSRPEKIFNGLLMTTLPLIIIAYPSRMFGGNPRRSISFSCSGSMAIRVRFEGSGDQP
jgi:hypothetical protein